jgi:TRAP-type C4-dicarboxylate transport system permease small subunit
VKKGAIVEKFDKRISALVSVVAAVILILMMLHILINALGRYIFSAPIYGTNEVVTYWYLPAVVLIGFVAAHAQKEHIYVSILFDAIPRRNQTEYTVLSTLISALTCVAFAWFGLWEAAENLEIGAMAGNSTIIMWPITFLVPVMFILLAMLLVVELIGALTGLRRGLETPPLSREGEGFLEIKTPTDSLAG